VPPLGRGDLVAEEPLRHAPRHLLRLAEERAALARHPEQHRGHRAHAHPAPGDRGRHRRDGGGRPAQRHRQAGRGGGHGGGPGSGGRDLLPADEVAAGAAADAGAGGVPAAREPARRADPAARGADRGPGDAVRAAAEDRPATAARAAAGQLTRTTYASAARRAATAIPPTTIAIRGGPAAGRPRDARSSDGGGAVGRRRSVGVASWATAPLVDTPHWAGGGVGGRRTSTRDDGRDSGDPGARTRGGSGG